MLIQSIVEHLSSLTLNGSENNSQHHQQQQNQQQYDPLSCVNNSLSSSSSSSSLLNIKGNITNGRQQQQQQCLSNEISTSTCPQPAQSNNNSTIIARPLSVSPSNSSKSLLSSNSCALSSNNNSSCSSWLQFFGGNDNSNSSNQHLNREESEKSMNVTRDWTEYWQSFMNRVENEYQCQDENIEMACEMVRQQVPLVESRIDIFFEEMFRKLEDCKLEMKKSVNSYSEQKLIELTKLKSVKREWNEWLKEEEPVLGLKQVTEKIDELQQVLKNLPNVKQAHEFDLIGMDAEIDNYKWD